MSDLLESQRSALENLDVIEHALSQRFSRNPNLIPKSLRPCPKHGNILTRKNRAYTKRLFRLQQHELKQFSVDYGRLLKLASNSFDHDATTVKQEMQNLKEEDSFEKFDNLMALVTNSTDEGPGVKGSQLMYSSFGSVDPKDVKIKVKKGTGKEIKMARRRGLLSMAASHLQEIEIDDTLDLKEFHKFYNENFSSSEIPYVQYLYSFHKFPYEKTTNENYRPYLKSLFALLLSRYTQLYPLSDSSGIFEEIDCNANEESSQTLLSTSVELYCAVCDKHFATENVYKAHLESKKHQKKASKAGEVSQGGRNKPNAWYEQAVKVLTRHLEEAIHQTEKSCVISERAKFNEKQDELDVENAYTEVEDSGNSDSDEGSDEDSDADADLFKNLPLGADGTPIPFWLYKLQGLHKTYTCEICGNVGYKGKQAFERHFNGTKHQKGLQLLGVTEDKFSLFKNIASIDEAQNLMQNLKKDTRTKQTEIHDAIEVEDKQGNVMSYLDYLDLKKQGLI
ncbi:sap61 [Candida margitis]|uniref:sap61 n=1 Tax=Candida margitis TaxID=1775924 RepID=UPI002226DF7E|nr:sap61 [Candida margitis]KAI5967947.1 sap61 [Candida margitis]